MIPYFDQPVLQIGTVTIYSFGALVGAAIFVFFLRIRRRAIALGLDASVAEHMVLWLAIGVLVTSHLFDRIVYFPAETLADPLSLLRLWDGISSFGGFIGALAAAMIFFRQRKLESERWKYLDIAAYVFPVSWLLGRTGCFISYDHPGIPTSFFLGQMYSDGIVRHNLGLLEALYIIPVLILFLALGRNKNRPGGFYLGLLCVLYAPVRFALDFLRIIDATYLGLTPGQWGSIVFLILGSLLLRHSIRSKNNKPSFHIIKTEDGTDSLYSDEYNQAMHSLSGAYNEALYKHVHPSKILENNSAELRVLDVGFGLGYNILALVIEFLKKNTDRKLYVFSLEKDSSFLSGINSVSFNDDKDEIYGNIKKAFTGAQNDFGKYSIQMLFGDARKTISALEDDYFNAVFHDPFSPAKNPELWSLEFFGELYRIMKADAVLTTYSSAPQIRSAMLEACFLIGKGPSVGKKREGTVASKLTAIPLLSEEEIGKLKADVKSAPYRDPGMKSAGKDILQQRISRMTEIRQEKKLQKHKIGHG
ncbi:MAG: prolipoprotein diacylglyceryl transferase family protein [Spirochaetota bacterium]